MIFFILFDLIYFFGLVGGRIISINTSVFIVKKKTVRLFVLYLFTFCVLFVYFLCMLSFCAFIVKKKKTFCVSSFICFKNFCAMNLFVYFLCMLLWFIFFMAWNIIYLLFR